MYHERKTTEQMQHEVLKALENQPFWLYDFVKSEFEQLQQLREVFIYIAHK